jgi:hypothetical protein
MTDNAVPDNLMPDFVDALEQRLRHHANEESSPSPSRRPRPRIALVLAAAGSVAAVALIVGLTTSSRPEDRRADSKPVDGRPLILKTAAVDAQNVIDEVQSGNLARLVLGADVRLTDARPVPAFGGISYVITGDKGWCLVAPDDAIDLKADPARRGGLTCQTRAVIDRFGIALIVGHNAIAAVPQGVPAPTLTAADGTIRHLKPSDQGIVTVEDGPSGSVLTLYATDGASNALHFR